MLDRQLETFDHNRILKRVASDVLGPLGLKQVGQSRSWIDDHGWWVINVAFGSSTWSRGSYLNVGTAFLWYEHPSIPFELDLKDGWKTPMGKFDSQFIEARRADWWERDVGAFAEGAAAHVSSIRGRTQGRPDLLARLREAPDRFWNRYHIGILAGLIGDLALSKRSLESVIHEADTSGIAWMASPRTIALRLLDLLADRESLSHAVAEVVATRRLQVRLPAIDENELVRSLASW